MKKMVFMFLGIFFFSSTFLFMASTVKCAKFDELFQPSWAPDHITFDGQLLKLKLDNYSGAGFASKSKYLLGKITAEIKLVPEDSAGTVTAFYMSSEGQKHHEFDFEFLGNTTGEPYLVQTNVYVNGVGNREQRVDLWFDPTSDFHAYSILWTQRHVVFLVDDTPIRLFPNTNSPPANSPAPAATAYPDDQPMGVYSSVWNADDWATQGGRVKTDWSHAPFVTTFRDFRIDACECSSEEDLKRCGGGEEQGSSNGVGKRFWWQEPVMEELSVHQSHQLMWVRAHHLVYDYCKDSERFPVAPPECSAR